MTNNKKLELFDDVINYLYEVINDNDEFERVLLNLGFDENYINDWIN